MADLKKFPVKLAVEQGEDGKFYVYGSHITNFGEITDKIDETNELLTANNALLVDANGHLVDVNGNLVEIDGELVSINTVEGLVTDDAVTGDNPGTISAKLRGITTQFVSLLTKQDTQIDVQGATDDAAVTAGSVGTISGKLRKISADIAALLTGQTDGSHLFSGSSLSVPFTTTTPQALALTDAAKYAWVSVQIQTQGTNSTVVAQGSNDGVNWRTIALSGADNIAGTGGIQSTTGTITIHGPLPTRYFRLNVTGISAGITEGTVVFSSTPRAIQSSAVTATISGTVPVTSGVSATAGVTTQVTASATSVSLKAANTSRRGLIIYNGGTTPMLIKFGATASSTSFVTKVAPGATYELPKLPIYTGVVDAIWEDTPTGSANVTELV